MMLSSQKQQYHEHNFLLCPKHHSPSYYKTERSIKDFVRDWKVIIFPASTQNCVICIHWKNIYRIWTHLVTMLNQEFLFSFWSWWINFLNLRTTFVFSGKFYIDCISPFNSCQNLTWWVYEERYQTVTCWNPRKPYVNVES